MHSNWLKFSVAAVGIIAAACQAPASTPTTVATPTTIATPILLASGGFTAALASTTTFEVHATGSGDSVSGDLEVSEENGAFSVDLQCTATTEGGLTLIGGDTTDSTHEAAPEGGRIAVLLQQGTPASVGLWFEDPPPAGTCAAFLENIPDDAADFLQPITGDLVLAP